MKKIILLFTILFSLSFSVSAKEIEFEGLKFGMTLKEVQKVLKTKDVKTSKVTKYMYTADFLSFENEVFNELNIVKVQLYFSDGKTFSGYDLYIDSETAVEDYNEKILPILKEYNFNWENNNKKTTSYMIYFVNVYNQDKVHLTFGLDLDSPYCWVLSLSKR